MSAIAHLQKQLKDLKQTPLGGFRIEVDDDIFNWTVWFSGPKDSLYHPGQYKAQLSFPQEFPYKPPEFRVLSQFWHPNVYDDGRVCISILHAPGTDEMNSIETASMRWTPVQSIEKVLVSIVSLLFDPDSSDAGAPANVDALVQFRKDKAGFVKRCQDLAKKSLDELPADFEFPPTEDAKPVMPRGTSALLPGADPSGAYGYYDDDDAKPAQASANAVPYSNELQQIRAMEMGEDKSDADLLALLAKVKGDVSRAIELLYEE